MSDLTLRKEVLAQLDTRTWRTPEKISALISRARRRGSHSCIFHTFRWCFPRFTAWAMTPSTLRIALVLDRLHREGAATRSMLMSATGAAAEWRLFRHHGKTD